MVSLRPFRWRWLCVVDRRVKCSYSACNSLRPLFPGCFEFTCEFSLSVCLFFVSVCVSVCLPLSFPPSCVCTSCLCLTLCVCVCVCVCVCFYVCVLCMHVCACVCVCVCTHACICTSMYLCMHACVHMSVCNEMLVEQKLTHFGRRPVVALLSATGASVGCSFDSFSIFLLSLKQQQNLLKIIFSCIHFAVWFPPPQNNGKNPVFYTSKLYGLTGMRMHQDLLT